jgi:hypothetical protein
MTLSQLGETTPVVEKSTSEFYHSGKGRRTRDVPLEHRRIIAWDSEGINISGKDKPQHLVLFGCSADAANPLIGQDLHVADVLEYIVKIGRQYPSAVHIGYGFRYDANMIIRHLPVRCLLELKEEGHTKYHDGRGNTYRIHWLPGKRFRVTQYHGKKKHEKTTVTIDDVISFFASSFIKATESVLADELTDEDREVIAHGKAERGQNTWDDMPDVIRYWTAEIRLMERLVEKFRGVMFSAGFMLRDWYGPGSLSSYLIRTRNLRDHIVNGPPDLPRGVHEASKIAYAGGRFELYRVGRFRGPVYSIDINSAYPFAMSQAPSLGLDHGFWEHVDSPTEISFFGVYRLRFKVPAASPFEARAMPLFHRDMRGNITFPNVCEGWYWSPEAFAAANMPGVEIVEGWEWVHDEARPFAFLGDLYEERMRIGKKNLLSMPYKLAANSAYGKFAQRVGWHEDPVKGNHPPRSHCLPLAGWTTSYTRAMLFNVLRQIPTEHLIAVETDGIYTTVNPADLAGVNMGDKLGEWETAIFDEMLYVQNGVYHRRVGDQWLSPKSRGLDTASVALPIVREYLQSCVPGQFPPLQIEMRPRFIGLTAAFASARPVKERHCVWSGAIDPETGQSENVRELVPGGKGKRVHIPEFCAACQEGKSAWDEPHTLIVRSRSDGSMSHPHFLPWEAGSQYPDMDEAETMDRLAEDMVSL